MYFILDYTMSIILVLLTVAFFTLLERKLLSHMQLRLGPNKVGFFGWLQPIADAVKLSFKSSLNLSFGYQMLYSPSSFLMLISFFLIWGISSDFFMLSFLMSVMSFSILTSLSLYGIIFMGVSSNSMFALSGSLRGVVQMMTYEIPLMTFLIFIIFILNSYSLVNFSYFNNQPYLYFFLMLVAVFFLTLLAEANRTPFDFSEGESELVSGFNTEYASFMFIVIFVSEYGLMLFSSYFCSKIIFQSVSYTMNTLMILMFCFLFIAIRGIFPRYRYDSLVLLSWMKITPNIMLMLLIYSVM